MNAKMRRKVSRVGRTRDFAKKHPIDDPGFTVVFNRLDSAVTRASEVIIQESEGHTTEEAATALRKSFRKSLRSNELTRLVRIADLAARDHPELRGQFMLPGYNIPRDEFLLAARALLEATIPQEELFVALGLGATFVADLGRRLDEIDAAVAAGNGGRTGHVTAGPELLNLMRECRRDIDVLGTYYGIAYAADPELLAGWRSACHLVVSARIRTRVATARVEPDDA